MLPGTTTTLDEHIYLAHLFQPKKGCNVKAAWKPCWEVSGPRFLRTSAEKTKRRKHKARLVFRLRHKKFKQSKKSKQSNQSMAKSEQSKKAKRSDMKSEQSSKKAKLSFKDLMNSWDKAAKTRASDMEQAESAIASTSTGTTKALQSFLRPCNIVGGGFARTPTGCVPRFVHAYWTRNAQSVA